MEENNTLSTSARIIAGSLLLAFTVACIVLIIGFWPDQLPALADTCKLYTFRLFHIELLSAQNCKSAGHTIQLNSLILILVALAGFLGNMIHISTSFTTFVGVGSFKKSWLLWYLVKPFTASALALGFYFVFRAGFLSYQQEAAIDPYGVMSISLLAGLFTDVATQKMKEIFEVTFRPKERADQLEKPTVTTVTPSSLSKTAPNPIVITGTRLDTPGLAVKMNSIPVSGITAKAGSIAFSYQVPAVLQAPETIMLEVIAKNGTVVHTVKLPLT